jgi:DNA (cytosine-5)-methyltransferase 1
MKGESGASSIDRPTPTITAHARHLAVADPFIIPYYGTAKSVSIDDPLDTVTTKGRFGLVEPVIGHEGPGRLVRINGELYTVDIRLRMLKNHELAAAMGFIGEDMQYEFAGTVEEVTKQIGNAVPVELADALVTAMMTDPEPRRRKSGRVGA